MILCEIDLTSTPFSNTKILTYETELSPSGNKVGFKLLDYEDFIIPYITDTILNLPSVVKFQNSINKMCGSHISMGKSLSQLKVRLMNSVAIKLHVENLRSILVYA